MKGNVTIIRALYKRIRKYVTKYADYNTLVFFHKPNPQILYKLCECIQAFAGTCVPGLLVGGPDAFVCSFSNCLPRYSLREHFKDLYIK